MPDFVHRRWRANSGPHVYMLGILPTELSAHPIGCYFLDICLLLSPGESYTHLWAMAYWSLPSHGWWKERHRKSRHLTQNRTNQLSPFTCWRSCIAPDLCLPSFHYLEWKSFFMWALAHMLILCERKTTYNKNREKRKPNFLSESQILLNKVLAIWKDNWQNWKTYSWWNPN